MTDMQLPRLRTLTADIQSYRQSHAAFRKAGNPRVPLIRRALDFQLWNRLRHAESSPLDDGLPWLTISSIRFLNKIVQPGTHVFEWGMGGSSLFLLDRGSVLTSVEHDSEWFTKTTASLGGRASWTPMLVEPEQATIPTDPSDWSKYETTDVSTQTCRFNSYARSIEAYPDGYFGLVLVDGRARPSCLHHAVPKVAQHGYLLLDNTERDTYRQEANTLVDRGFRRCDFSGATAYANFFTITTIWEKL